MQPTTELTKFSIGHVACQLRDLLDNEDCITWTVYTYSSTIRFIDKKTYYIQIIRQIR